MPIAMQCVHCAAKLRARDTDAGKTKPCPKCGKPVKVPGKLTHVNLVDTDQPTDQPVPAEADSAASQADAPDDAQDQPPQPASSTLKWVAVALIFAVGVAASFFILNRGKNDKETVTSRGLKVDEPTLKEIRDLHERACELARGGKKEEAIKLYKQLIPRMEKLHPGIAIGLKQMRRELKVLETGKTMQQVIDEEKGIASGEPKPEQPPAEPDKTEGVQPERKPAEGEAAPAEPEAAQPEEKAKEGDPQAKPAEPDATAPPAEEANEDNAGKAPEPAAQPDENATEKKETAPADN